ncbi:MAG: hypothetical protein ACXU8O_03970, partial [Asticcacaulis sp.]
AKDPSNTQWQNDVSVSVERLGDVLMAQGDLAGARKAFEESLAIRRSLAAKDTGNSLWQNNDWIVLRKLAKIPDSGVTWQDVVTQMEQVDAKGMLSPADRHFLDEARANAAAEKTGAKP